MLIYNLINLIISYILIPYEIYLKHQELKEIKKLVQKLPTQCLKMIQSHHHMLTLYQYKDDLIKKHGCWEKVLTRIDLSEEFILEFIHLLKWSHVCLHQKLSQQFIQKHYYNMDWKALSRNDNIVLSMSFIEENINKFDLTHLSKKNI